jgi:phosphoribosylamine--glycine ligase
MKVLVIGSGGREHALAWKLLQSPQVERCFCLPGNGGTATLDGCENLPLAIEDFAGIAEVAKTQGVEFVVVGPELPLSLGIADYLQRHQIKVFGPTQAGAQLESSKSWAKELMVAAGVPVAGGETFTAPEAAKTYARQQGAPIVVKADGLAAGKGVIVATTVAEAETAIATLFDTGSERVVVEECLIGEEVSVLALTDGITVRPLLPAQDHKRIGEGDTGGNTGGMGAYAPAPLATPQLMQRVEREILQPTAAALRNRGIDYRGVLYAGLMVAPDGEIKVLEYNCRFGDPETQAILPLLETRLEELILACIDQKLGDLPPIRWQAGSAACVVLAAAGYPGDYEKGKEIQGIEAAAALGVQVFQAGTKLQGERLLTDGGRVLGVTGTGENLATALEQAYPGVACIKFDGKYYRRDIGYRALLR